MDAEEIQIQVQGRGCNKFPRIGNGRKIGPPEEEEVDGGENRLRGWHGASRIIRVSRASGGKDRHSKVWTSKGLRDRRVRLSVTTAIQFYDLQDRLGYDQPSKAVEWLIKAAADSISELPALNPSFPETPNRPDSIEELAGGENENHHQAQINNSNNQNNQSQISMSKSSSTSETSKGSGLSLSRSEVRVNRVKASRERARERAKGGASNPIPQNSFTELLTAGAASASAPMDYFSSSGLLGPSSSSSSRMQAFHHHSIPVSPYNHHPDQLQQFSFVPDHYIPVVSSQGSDVYNLNFTISPSGGYSSNRGTLQSNSPSFLPHHHLQRYGDGSSNVPFFLAPGENNHHHQHLQQQHQHIFYGDSKEKGKN